MVEPALEAFTSVSVASADAGDLVTYTLSVAHAVASTASAYALNVTLEAPAHSRLDLGLVQTTLGTVISDARTEPTKTGTISLGNKNRAYVLVDVLSEGATFTVSFGVVLEDSVTPGMELKPYLTVSYATAGALAPGWRSYEAALANAPLAGDGAPTSVHVPGPQLGALVRCGSVAPHSTAAFNSAQVDVTPGERVRYAIDINLSEAQYRFVL